MQVRREGLGENITVNLIEMFSLQYRLKLNLKISPNFHDDVIDI